MRAIVIKGSGGPEVLAIEERPDPEPRSGHVLIEVKAFGINQAEIYFRKGAWGEAAEISGIECVGVVRSDPGGRFMVGQKVMALVGGLGRNLSGSYAELTNAPINNVVAIETDLSWEDLAAIPESYATAWTSLIGVLELTKGQTILVRGAGSALGHAALNIARHAGAYVVATTRQPSRTALLKTVGADDVLLESPDISEKIRSRHISGLDAALDIVGGATILDTMAALRRAGRACLVGFLGGGGPLTLNPVFEMPSGVHLSVFASALVTGGPDFALSEIPFQAIVDRVADGTYRAKPAHVFRFEDIATAHRLVETGHADGKVVASLS